LRSPYEVRDHAGYFEDIPELKLPKEMLDLAAHIITGKSGHFDPAQFEDRYENALVDLLKKKEAGEKIEPAKAGPAPRVVNLMEALRASLDTVRKKATRSCVSMAERPARQSRNARNYPSSANLVGREAGAAQPRPAPRPASARDSPWGPGNLCQNTFYDFPAEHWKHLRTTNPNRKHLRHRAPPLEGMSVEWDALAMVFKLVEDAQKAGAVSTVTTSCQNSFSV
jgi:hypothetical protein